MKYIWKINMIDGKSFYVESEENDLLKFTTQILPQYGKETVSLFNCKEEEFIPGIKCKYNSVVIVGSKVSSVEFYQNK